jgi:hypothetical protein
MVGGEIDRDAMTAKDTAPYFNRSMSPTADVLPPQ